MLFSLDKGLPNSATYWHFASARWKLNTLSRRVTSTIVISVAARSNQRYLVIQYTSDERNTLWIVLLFQIVEPIRAILSWLRIYTHLTHLFEYFESSLIKSQSWETSSLNITIPYFRTFKFIGVNSLVGMYFYNMCIVTFLELCFL